MASDTIVDIYCHIFQDPFFQEMNRIAPRLGNIGARLRGVKKLFDLDERFREMDQFGDYRQIISLPNPPIEDLVAGAAGLNLARIGNDADKRAAPIQREHHTRTVASASKAPLPKAEAPVPALYRRYPALGELDVGLPHERAIGEEPKPIVYAVLL